VTSMPAGMHSPKTQQLPQSGKTLLCPARGSSSAKKESAARLDQRAADFFRAGHRQVPRLMRITASGRGSTLIRPQFPSFFTYVSPEKLRMRLTSPLHLLQQQRIHEGLTMFLSSISNRRSLFSFVRYPGYSSFRFVSQHRGWCTLPVPPKSHTLIKQTKKPHNRSDCKAFIRVEVAGFEPAAFWSRTPVVSFKFITCCPIFLKLFAGV